MSVYHDVEEFDAAVPSEAQATTRTAFHLPDKIKRVDRHLSMFTPDRGDLEM